MVRETVCKMMTQSNGTRVAEYRHKGLRGSASFCCQTPSVPVHLPPYACTKVVRPPHLLSASSPVVAQAWAEEEDKRRPDKFIGKDDKHDKNKHSSAKKGGKRDRSPESSEDERPRKKSSGPPPKKSSGPPPRKGNSPKKGGSGGSSFKPGSSSSKGAFGSRR